MLKITHQQLDALAAVKNNHAARMKDIEQIQKRTDECQAKVDAIRAILASLSKENTTEAQWTRMGQDIAIARSHNE